ncbi:hypothetical protein CKY28_12380 [Sphingomonas lenta]|uniref:Ribonuclease VapC n=1 Tax=Sphingomonas lenta TaxID=1141887 RepID=A0A2A2SC86_9SPHN|nr:hypothetical protein CKY28_12380 [Sphingomonas lenta]
MVVDCSIVGPLALADEPALSERVTDALSHKPLIAPAHWPLEVMNMLHVAERRGRLDRLGRDAAARQIRDLAVTVRTDTGDFAWTEASRLADLHGLTIYDAAYLELAIRLRASLATRDGDLIVAARAENVPVLI